MHGEAYTAEDIRKYLSGDMPAAEMHALERAALDDPFLADAIEGMEQKTGFEKDIKDLKEKLNSRRNKKNNAGFYWKAAAVLVVVTTAVALVLLVDDKKAAKQEKILAKAEERKDTQGASTPAVKSEETVTLSPAPRAVSKSQPPQAANAEASEIQEPAEREERAAKILLSETRRRAADSIVPFAAPKNPQISEPLEGKASGVIIDREGRPDEVVVVGYSAKKKSAKRFSGMSVETRNQKAVTPSGGWQAFDDYLQRNKNIAGSDSLKTGVEVVTFTIDEYNRPENIRIRKSLSPAHDTATVRMLQNGPDWEIIKGKNRKVRLDIIF